MDPAPAPGGGIQLEVALEPAERGLCVRSAVPDGGHPYVALTQASLAACFAGVNACGLAAAGRVLAPPEPGERCRAPGLLLVDQCLERLDNVEAALEWCERRPGGGRARLLFADASGAVAALEVEGEKRLRCDPTSAAGAELEGPCGQVRLDPGAGALELLLPDAEPERFEAAHSR
ncbi:MAG: hypothetical protein QNK03_00820 [Myxococcota bacterium]|nr:hypothetical protein [Myxococcota bacterium]